MPEPNPKDHFIHALLIHRLDQICDSLLLNDPGCRRLGEEPDQILQRLIKTLTPEERDLLDDYNSGRNAQEGREGELLYAQGIRDGIRLMDWIERVRAGESV
jgi:hypothetical protein